MIRRLALLLCINIAASAQAQTLAFPGNAILQTEVTRELDGYAMPTGIWENGSLPTEIVEGRVTKQAWRIEGVALNSLELIRPFRAQLNDAGFETIFECQTEACGGFDFRFGIETLKPPEMQVNLGDFRFLSATRDGENGEEAVMLLVSAMARAGFVQVTSITPPNVETEPLAAPNAPILRPGGGQTTAGIAAGLNTIGRAVLSDLTFATGSAQLSDAPFASLQILADYLDDYPDRTVALVGHTDSAGSLDANINLSRRRAASVLERLVADYGVNRRQLEAQGMGYLSPIASNLTDEGRDANRRVEVIITSTEE